MSDKVTVWISKYALSSGIYSVEADQVNEFGYAHYRVNGFWHSNKIGRDAFYTKEEAIADAEERRIKKLKSLDKQVKKISALKFGD